MKKKPILEFTVSLSAWRCGSTANLSKRPNLDEDTCYGRGETQLLNSSGYKCCLGFACQQAGYKHKLLNIGNPTELRYLIPGLTYRNGDNRLGSTEFTHKAIGINDDPLTTVKEKQELLIKLGKQHNIKINFVP